MASNICPSCEASLRGGAREGSSKQCPECGKWVTVTDDRIYVVFDEFIPVANHETSPEQPPTMFGLGIRERVCALIGHSVWYLWFPILAFCFGYGLVAYIASKTLDVSLLQAFMYGPAYAQPAALLLGLIFAFATSAAFISLGVQAKLSNGQTQEQLSIFQTEYIWAIPATLFTFILMIYQAVALARILAGTLL